MKILERPLLKMLIDSAMQKKNGLFSHVFIDSVDHQHCNINFSTVFLPSHQYPRIPLGYFNMEALTVSLCQ